MSLQAVNFKCTFCNKTFKRKSWYEKHLCEKKRRFMESNNISTIRAHRLFNHWQTRTGFLKKGKTKDLASFCKSPYYNSFIGLAEFCVKEFVVTSYRYVDWLVENRIPDFLWKSKDTLEQYREYTNNDGNISNQVNFSCNQIRTWCHDNKINSPQMFFSSVPSIVALDMIRRNKITPWILFCYPNCLENLTIRLLDNSELHHELNDYCDFHYWGNKIKEQHIVDEVIDICDRLLVENVDDELYHDD